MDQFKSRRKTKRFAQSPWAAVILVVAIAILAKATWSIYQKYALSSQKLVQAKSQLADIQNQEQSLSESIDSLSTASGTEAALRTNFRVVKPGESLAVIVDNATDAPAVIAPTENFLGKVAAWFGRIF
jgi:cell division protein FtsB